ncbi:diguanylate cyclase [Azonexus sp.]|uniref:sensor domain-containing diguanylate cyclase n=1 Tax=Azonexus sp. TaxID=1872668 RepID=UPI0035B0B807
MHVQDVLNLLRTPVWIVSPASQEILFANGAAQALSGGADLAAMRHGEFSAHAEERLSAYLPALRAREPAVEVWTVGSAGEPLPLCCHLSLFLRDGQPEAIVVEGQLPERSDLPPRSTPPAGVDSAQQGFYELLFRTNSAPMLLIDPSDDGLIIDANQAASRFYGYSREAFCRRHTWEINAMGRAVLPIMYEISRLPGGHKPLNFVHRMADGSLRDVQTYAGPVDIDGRRLMLCIVHDVTEQKRLRKELELAASRDHLTGLWNRRQFLHLLDNARAQKRRYDVDYSLMLLDADHFKSVNDRYGHDAGDEVLVLLARALEARVRETDTVCRWGGEEFIVLLPQTDLENAALLAESLRRSVEQIRVPHLPPVTVSIGVAQHCASETGDSLIKRADEALYQAKAAGRNRVVAAPAEAPGSSR